MNNNVLNNEFNQLKKDNKLLIETNNNMEKSLKINCEEMHIKESN